MRSWSSSATSAARRLDRLIERYGIDVKLFDWEPEADRLRKVARNEHDPCGCVYRKLRFGSIGGVICPRSDAI